MSPANKILMLAVCVFLIIMALSIHAGADEWILPPGARSIDVTMTRVKPAKKKPAKAEKPIAHVIGEPLK